MNSSVETQSERLRANVTKGLTWIPPPEKPALVSRASSRRPLTDKNVYLFVLILILLLLFKKQQKKQQLLLFFFFFNLLLLLLLL